MFVATDTLRDYAYALANSDRQAIVYPAAIPKSVGKASTSIRRGHAADPRHAPRQRRGQRYLPDRR
jgi:hypothetical protein